MIGGAGGDGLVTSWCFGHLAFDGSGSETNLAPGVSLVPRPARRISKKLGGAWEEYGVV